MQRTVSATFWEPFAGPRFSVGSRLVIGRHHQEGQRSPILQEHHVVNDLTRSVPASEGERGTRAKEAHRFVLAKRMNRSANEAFGTSKLLSSEVEEVVEVQLNSSFGRTPVQLNFS